MSRAIDVAFAVVARVGGLALYLVYIATTLAVSLFFSFAAWSGLLILTGLWHPPSTEYSATTASC